MTLFEYIAAAFTLVLSLAVVRLIGGLPSALLPDRRYWVHLVLVAGLFLLMAGSFWGFWSFRDVEWTFPRFLLVLVSPALTYFFAATIIPGAPDEVESWREFYYSVRKRLFTGWIAYALLLPCYSTMLLEMPLIHPARLVEFWMLLFAVIGTFSSGPRIHAGLALGLIAVIVAFSFSLLAQPGALAR